MAASPVQPVRGVYGRVRLEETGCEQAADLRDGQRDHAWPPPGGSGTARRPGVLGVWPATARPRAPTRRDGRPDGQAHQGIAEVTGAGDRHLGRRGQPRPGQVGPPRRARCRTRSCRSARRRTSSRVTASHPAWRGRPVPCRRRAGERQGRCGPRRPAAVTRRAASARTPRRRVPRSLLVSGRRQRPGLAFMNVSSSATCRACSAAGRVPGVRANSLMGCACAGLTGWSWGMRVKLAWLWRWRVRRPAWLMIIWNNPASAIPCSLATVAQEGSGTSAGS